MQEFTNLQTSFVSELEQSIGVSIEQIGNALQTGEGLDSPPLSFIKSDLQSAYGTITTLIDEWLAKLNDHNKF